MVDMAEQLAGVRAERYGWADLAPLRHFALRYWPLVAGVLVLVLPTMFGVARENWSTEQGAHGPIVLATALWLFWRRWNEVRALARPGNTPIALAAFLVFALVPDIGERTEQYSEERWLQAAQPLGEPAPELAPSGMPAATATEPDASVPPADTPAP